MLSFSSKRGVCVIVKCTFFQNGMRLSYIYMLFIVCPLIRDVVALHEKSDLILTAKSRDITIGSRVKSPTGLPTVLICGGSGNEWTVLSYRLESTMSSLENSHNASYKEHSKPVSGGGGTHIQNGRDVPLQVLKYTLIDKCTPGINTGSFGMYFSRKGALG